MVADVPVVTNLTNGSWWSQRSTFTKALIVTAAVVAVVALGILLAEGFGIIPALSLGFLHVPVVIFGWGSGLLPIALIANFILRSKKAGSPVIPTQQPFTSLNGTSSANESTTSSQASGEGFVFPSKDKPVHAIRCDNFLTKYSTPKIPDPKIVSTRFAGDYKRQSKFVIHGKEFVMGNNLLSSDPSNPETNHAAARAYRKIVAELGLRQKDVLLSQLMYNAGAHVLACLEQDFISLASNLIMNAGANASLTGCGGTITVLNEGEFYHLSSEFTNVSLCPVVGGKMGFSQRIFCDIKIDAFIDKIFPLKSNSYTIRLTWKSDAPTTLDEFSQPLKLSGNPCGSDCYITLPEHFFDE